MSFVAALRARIVTASDTAASRLIAGHERETSSRADTISAALRSASAKPALPRRAESSSIISDTLPVEARAASIEFTDLLAEPVFDIGAAQRFDNRFDFAIENFCELVHGEPYPVISNAILRKIIRPDFR